MNNKNEKVRDGYFQDLPEDIQKKIMNIHRLIVDTAYETLRDHNYTDLKNDKWAKKCLDEFLLEPTPNDDIGSVRVYKQGKRYRCMIQLTGHFANHMNDFNQELMHDYIKNIFVSIRPTIRRKYDCTISNEGEHGQPFEGFDLFTKPKVAEEIWNKFEDFKTRAIKESEEELFDDIEEFDEKSHGTLKHSFRLCLNAENGHLLRITFDLDPSSIMMAGDHTNQNGKQFEKLQHLRDHITKTGSGDFSSIGIVQGITDLDTGKPLQSADTVGIIGSDPNSVRFTVPDKYSDGSGKDFKQYPVAIREKIAAELNLKNANKGVTRFTVGQKETRPSYKSTRAFSNTGALYNNQWTAIKGFHNPNKQELRHNPYARGNLDVKQNSNYVNFSNMSVEKFIQWAKSNMGILQKAANSNSIPRNKRFTIDDAIESFERIEMVYRKNSAERIRNVISDEKYSTLAKDIINGINAAKSVVTESIDIEENDILDSFIEEDEEDYGFIEDISMYNEDMTIDDIDMGLYIESLEYRDTDDIFEFIEDVIMEKKTKTQYRIDAFKKRFNFVPEKNAHGHNDPNRGTITINGKQVKVDLGNSKIVNIGGADIPREFAFASINSDDPKWVDRIGINPNHFFKLKNKSQDAVINHELGHLIMHNMATNSAVRNNKFISADLIKTLVRNALIATDFYDKEDIDKMVIDSINQPEVQSLINKKIDDKALNILRNASLKAAGKYLKNHRKNPHLNEMEAEADAYAKQHGHNVMKGVRQASRIAAKGMPKVLRSTGYFDTQEEIDNTMKGINKLQDEDHKIRKRMLTDKRIASNTIYKKESVDVSNLMSEKQIIGIIAGLSPNEMSQTKANTIANLITKHMLPRWAPSFNKFTIVFDTKSEASVVEFKVSKMTQDFISRFLDNREDMNGFIHRSPEIKIRITAKAFSTIKEPADILYLLKAAVKYYDSKINGYANKLMIETRKLGHKMNYLISNTKLSGLVSFPLSLLFVFDKVDMSNKDTFNLSNSDIEAINAFIHNIHSRYPTPEKEKKEIIDALQTMISHLRESVNYDENYDDFIHLSSEVEKYLFEGYKNEIEKADNIWISENVDPEWTYHQQDPQIKALIESKHMKKLKKIPRDLVAYIQIETEAIEDANDKMLIASYCIDKLEIVEWYIELLEVGSDKYIVPDSLSYLRTVRTQLIQCYKNIMAVKVKLKSQRPLYDINVLPAGYRD